MPTKQEKLLEEFEYKIKALLLKAHMRDAAYADRKQAVHQLQAHDRDLNDQIEDTKICLSQAFQQVAESRDAQIVEMLENAKVTLTSVEESIAAGMGKVEAKLVEMHAIGYNTALDDAIKSLKDSK